jgi:hypothetical protein
MDTTIGQLPSQRLLPAVGADRRTLVLTILLLPWVLWLIYPWTLTPVGAIDAWIYRGLGQNLPNAHHMFPKFYYTSRLFVLLPCYLLNTFMTPGMAHAAYSFGMLYVFLFALSDFAAPLATWRTRFFLVLFGAACPYVLRTQGWGYIDGFVITASAMSLAFLARALRPQYTASKRALFSALSGACFCSMAITHPMAVVLGSTLILYFVHEWFLVQRRFRPLQTVGVCTAFGLGGILAILAMCTTSRLMFGEFYFFRPIIEAAQHVSKTATVWKLTDYQWLQRADWLLIPALAMLGSVAMLLPTVFRARLTGFERFVYLNAVLLLGGMALVDYLAAGFWFQFSYYASYFLPTALLAIAAMLGESSSDQPRVWNIAGLATLLVLIAAIVQRIEMPYIKVLAGNMADLRLPPGHILKFFNFQLGAAALTVLLILLHRFALRHRLPETRWLFPAVCACGVAMLGQISHYPIPTGPKVEVSRNIAGVIGVIQQELGPVRPLFWFDEHSPLKWQYVSVNAAYLAGYSGIARIYPNIDTASRPEWRSVSDSSSEPWLGGEQLVILTEHPETLPVAVATFHGLGLDLQVSRQVFNPAATGGYWIIFAKTVNVPVERTLLPADLSTNLKNARMIDGGPNGHPDRTSSGEAGFLAYGPYTQLAAGHYSVSFNVKVEGPGSAADALLLDVCSQVPTPAVLGSRTIHGSELANPPAFQQFTLDLALTTARTGVEFRVATPGNATVTLDSISIHPLAPATTGRPEISPR